MLHSVRPSGTKTAFNSHSTLVFNNQFNGLAKVLREDIIYKREKSGMPLLAPETYCCCGPQEDQLLLLLELLVILITIRK